MNTINTTCPTRIYSDGWLKGACGKTAKHEHDGVMYCKSHHPPTVKAKNEARQEAFKRRWDAEHAARIKANADRAEQTRRAECFSDLLEALKLAEAALSDIGDADREPGGDVAWLEARAAQAIPTVRAAIAKATGEQP